MADSVVDTCANGVSVGPYLGSTPKLALSTNGKWTDRSATLSALPAAFLHASALADINGDGAIDAYLGSISAGPDKTPYLRINDGAPDLVLLPNNSTSNVITTIAQQRGTVSLDAPATDLNGDGYWDLVILQAVVDPAAGIDYRGGKIQILINQRGQGFVDEIASRGAPGSDAVGHYDRYHGTLTVFDINGDGALDLIALRTVPGGYDNHIFLNDGNGRITRADVLSLPSRGIIIALSAMPNEPIRVGLYNPVSTAWCARRKERSGHVR